MDSLLELDFNLNDFCGKTDEELAVLAKNDRSAEVALISRYSKLIFIKSKIYANPDTDSEDLQQEGLMSLLKAIDAFEPERGNKFSTFAETCIVNRMRTVSARSGKGLASADRVDDNEAADFLAVDDDPESIYLNKEFFTELLKGIDTVLSPMELKAFRLCIRGMSYKQAADKLGISEKSVDNAMQRARKKIRSRFGDAE